MKKYSKTNILALLTLSTSSSLVYAEPNITPQQIQNVLKDNPQILQKVLESDPSLIKNALQLDPSLLNKAVENSPELIKTAIASNPTINTLITHQSELVTKATAQHTQKLQELENQFDSFIGNNNQSVLVQTAQKFLPLGIKAIDKNGEIVKTTQQYADRHIYFTTTAGYQWIPSATKKQQESQYDFSQKDNLTTNFALGIYVLPHKETNRHVANEALKKLNHLKETKKYDTVIKKETHTPEEVSYILDVKKAEKEFDDALDSVNIGYKRGFAIQGEYNEVRAKVTSEDDVLSEQKSAQKNISIVGLIPVLPETWAKTAYEDYDTHVYGIVGAGYTTLKSSENREILEEENRDIRSKTFEDGLGIIGLGYSKGIKNSKTQIIGEVRAVYNVKENYWQPQAMAGIRVGLGQYASKYLP